MRACKLRTAVLGAGSFFSRCTAAVDASSRRRLQSMWLHRENFMHSHSSANPSCNAKPTPLI
eukprot:3262501-Rhodomonas_salina.1